MYCTPIYTTLQILKGHKEVQRRSYCQSNLLRNHLWWKDELNKDNIIKVLRTLKTLHIRIRTLFTNIKLSLQYYFLFNYQTIDFPTGIFLGKFTLCWGSGTSRKSRCFYKRLLSNPNWKTSMLLTVSNRLHLQLPKHLTTLSWPKMG